MTTRATAKQIQGPSMRHTWTPEERLEDAIRQNCGVEAQVEITTNLVVITVTSYADYVLAKSAIKHLVGSKTILKG